MIPNPLLDNIKQHYPTAWGHDPGGGVELGKYTVCDQRNDWFSGAAYRRRTERHYNIGYQRQPLLVLRRR